MSNTIKKVENTINKLLPILAITGVISTNYSKFLLLLPIIISLLPSIIEKIKILFIKNSKIYSVEYIDNHHNVFHNFIESYITDNFEQINSDSYSSTRSNNKTGEPIYNLSDGSVIRYNLYNNNYVMIKKEHIVENRLMSRKLIVSSDKIENIKEFERLVLDNIEKKNKYVVTGLDIKGDYYSSEILTNKTFDNIFIDDTIKEELLYDLDKFLNSEDIYYNNGWIYKRGYIFSGNPGTGKSSLVYAISKYTNKEIFKIDSNVLKYINTIEIPNNSIIFIDDIDTFKITNKRNEKEEDSKNEIKDIVCNVSLGDVLNILDGYTQLYGNIIVMTTNHIDNIDPALIRPGRIDKRFLIEYMTRGTINKILQKYYNKTLELDTILEKAISSAEFINSVIIPNIDNFDNVEKYLKDKENELKN